MSLDQAEITWHWPEFVNNRPFLTGALIKAPFRVEFVVRKLFTGDNIGAAVGTSWMILGDGGLALNDEKLKLKLKNIISTPVDTQHNNAIGEPSTDKIPIHRRLLV